MDNDKNKDNKNITLKYLIENYIFIRYILAIILGIAGGIWIIAMNELFVYILHSL